MAAAVPVIKVVASVLGGIGAAAGGVAAVKSAGQKAPKMPELPPTAPLPDEAALALSRRRRYASELSRSGVQSTILSDPSQKQTLG